MKNYFNLFWTKLKRLPNWMQGRLLWKILFYYFIVLTIASILIMTPWAWTEKTNAWNFVNSFYTVTSAISTTGLTIYDTAEEMALFGQIILFILIFTGGFGLIFFKVYILKTLHFLFFRQKQSFVNDSEQQFERGAFNPKSSQKILWIGFCALLGVYAIGFICLFFYFFFTPIAKLNYYYNFQNSFWSALFHSVSATNNAGFDIFKDGGDNFNSLQPMVNHYFVQFVFIFQFIIGGLGFVVFWELWERFHNKVKGIKNKRKLSLFTKMILIFYSLAIIVSISSVLGFEMALNQERNFNFDNFMKIIFNTLSSRSAGFSTVNIKTYFSEPTKYLLSFLMWIGCAPLSTGGGIKITTFVVAFLAFFVKTDSRNNSIFFKRRVSSGNIAFVYKICFFSLMIIFVASIIGIFNIKTVKGTEFRLLDSVFYSTSALGNVGLSTFQVEKKGWIFFKMVSILAMLIGQIGVAQTIQSARPKEVTIENEPYSPPQAMLF